MIPVSAAVPICSHCLARPDMVEVFRFSLHRCRVEGPSRTSGFLPGPDRPLRTQMNLVDFNRVDDRMRHQVTDPPGDATRAAATLADLGTSTLVGLRRVSPRLSKAVGSRMKDCVCRSRGILLEGTNPRASSSHVDGALLRVRRPNRRSERRPEAPARVTRDD
jgi:hypothetical protein